jgi:hypothetical protein
MIGSHFRSQTPIELVARLPQPDNPTLFSKRAAVAQENTLAPLRRGLNLFLLPLPLLTALAMTDAEAVR